MAEIAISEASHDCWQRLQKVAFETGPAMQFASLSGTAVLAFRRQTDQSHFLDTTAGREDAAKGSSKTSKWPGR